MAKKQAACRKQSCEQGTDVAAGGGLRALMAAKRLEAPPMSSHFLN
jgi:hypothetical protein